MLALYNLALILLLPFLPLIKLVTRKRGRFSILSRLKTDFKGNENGILIHASSIGEVKSIAPLLKVFDNVILTVLTDYGLDVARKLYPNVGSGVLPIDIYPITLKFLKRSRPRAILLYETEIWPSLIASAKKLGIPVFTVSGKISDRSFKRYLLLKPLLRNILKDVSFLARSEKDAERAVRIGFKNVKLVGDLKFDLPVPDQVPLEVEGRRTIILWASLHRGECKLALEMHRALREHHPGLLSIVAPRHIGDLGLIKDLRYQFRSKTYTIGKETDVYIVDTVGELASLYRFCDVAVIGGSFIKGIGGHNPLEAVIFRKPVIIGQFASDFRDIIDRLKGIVISSRRDLKENLEKLLLDENYRRDLGQKLYNSYTRYAGVSERIRKEVLSVIK
jgi:3-deoxy-D-manno-octulosonic-acid transferase